MKTKTQDDVMLMDSVLGAETVTPQPETKVMQRAELAEAARVKAAELIGERRFSDAKKALEEADVLSSPPTEAELKASALTAQAEAARARATQLLSERKFAEARKALDEADELETSAPDWKEAPHRLLGAMRSWLPKRDATSHGPIVVKSAAELSIVDRSMKIVSRYSKIAAAAGVLPGGLLNFAAILAVQVVMVIKIAKVFGHNENKDRVRGSILSLIGSVIPTGLGHGAGLAIAAYPAVLAGAVVYFVFTPVLAYALTRAVGNAYIMHFESGGTLLTFDPKAFTDYFVREFRKAGGAIADAAAHSEPSVAATA